MPDNGEGPADWTLSLLLLNLDTAGFSRGEILKGDYRTNILAMNSLYLANQLGQTACITDWKLHMNDPRLLGGGSGRVCSFEVIDELGRYRETKINRREGLVSLDVSQGNPLAGLAAAVNEAREEGSDLTLEALDAYFVANELGGSDALRSHAQRYGLLNSPTHLDSALDRVERLNLIRGAKAYS